MIYHDKYFHDNITLSILAYRDNHANDNTVDTISTKSLSAMQSSGYSLKIYTVEPPITDPPRSGRSFYSGQASCYGLHSAYRIAPNFCGTIFS